MPIQSTACPKCGKETSEYAPGKWKCLHCGRKFIYEKPPAVTQYIVPSQHVYIELPETETEPETEPAFGIGGWTILFCLLIFSYAFLGIVGFANFLANFLGIEPGIGRLLFVIVVFCFLFFVFRVLKFLCKSCFSTKQKYVSSKDKGSSKNVLALNKLGQKSIEKDK